MHFSRIALLRLWLMTTGFTGSAFAASLGHDSGEDPWPSALIPKREVGADQFVADHPTYDGRGVVIAVFDTGVDPAAAGLALTTTGERKVLDMIDASGSGDVDTSTVAAISDQGTLDGLTGLSLILPTDLVNPTGEFRLGMKPAHELFPASALARLQAQVAAQWAADLSLRRQARARDPDEALASAREKAAADRNREERNLVALDQARTALDDAYATSGPGLIYDCVIWHDGDHWRVIVDTNRNGDLTDDPMLRPYGVAGEYGTFDPHTNATYAVQVYENGNLLSLVTMSGTHGTHVASIAAAHYPEETARNGVAPGARILSVKIGDLRTDGSSYGTSERRAIATAARYGVDIMNASWGGSSVYNDGQDQNSLHYRMLADRFDILAVMSAGNGGPGLSTVGSAGGEVGNVLGVGAYSSTAMGKALYNTLQDAPDAALQFSSRGPTKDGDQGVDVMAPGAAWASYSAESMQATEMINGTSMSAPSAAGVAALVLSAGRQNDLNPRPALMRQALMLGAAPIIQEAEFTRGAGMVHAPGAWEKLRELAGEPAFEVFYDKAVTGGTFVDSGRGLYLRGPLDELRRRVTVDVSPHWPESSDVDQRFAFEQDFVLRADHDWIEVPDFMHLANGPQRLTLHLTVPPQDETARQQGDVIISGVRAYLAGREELGPVFTVPITVVRPADPALFVDNVLRTSLHLNPAVTARRFYAVPTGMEKLHIKVKHRADDPVARRFFMQVITLAAESSQSRYKTRVVQWMDEGDDGFIEVDVRPGEVAELAFNQYFYSPEPATLELELAWKGVGLPPNSLALEPNQGYLPVELAPRVDATYGVEASLSHAVHVSLATRTTDFFDDERAQRPASALTPGPVQDRMIRFEYEVDFEEPVTASLGEQQDYDLSEGFTGGRLKVVHESGEVLYNGPPDVEKPIDFPQGSSTIMGEQSTTIPGILDSLQNLPLRLMVPLDPNRILPVLPGQRARFRGTTVEELDLRRGRQEIILLQDTLADDFAELKPVPDYLQGSLVFKDDEDHEIAQVALRYFAGDSPEKVMNQDPKPQSAEDRKSAPEKLADDLHELQWAFVREHRLAVAPPTARRRQELLDDLEEAHPEDPAPWLERAIAGSILAGYVSGFWGERPSAPTDEAASAEPATEGLEQEIPAETQILAWLDRAEELARPADVSRFFGARPEALPGDLESRDELAVAEEVWSRQRDALATIHRLRSDLHRGAGRMDEAWQEWAELQRWEPEASPDSEKLAVVLHQQAKLPGLALASLNALLEEDPYDAELLTQRLELYRELGWHRHAETTARLLAVRRANLVRINSL